MRCLGYHRISTIHINLLRTIVTRKQQTPAQPASLLDRDGFIESDELADYLRVSPATLDQWSSRGGGPAFHRIGRYRRYAPADVRAWLSAQRRDDTPAA